MKIEKIHKYKTNLLRLKLLKTKIYKNDKTLNYFNFKDIETRLKKSLHIIYKMHVANKKILLIGVPLTLSKQTKQLLKNTKHNFIPESLWVNGVMTNSFSSFKHLLKKNAIKNEKTSQSLLHLKNRIDLIVVLDESLNKVILNESLQKHIPTISLNCNFNTSNFNLSTYKIPGNFNFTMRKSQNNFLYAILNSLFKKAEIFRKKRIKHNIRKQKLIKKKPVRHRRKNAYLQKK